MLWLAKMLKPETIRNSEGRFFMTLCPDFQVENKVLFQRKSESVIKNEKKTKAFFVVSINLASTIAF